MRTAAKQQVVAFKSFLRTVVHELAHHLDYELFALEETFHTEGFYKRESSLANALFAQESASGRTPPAAPGGTRSRLTRDADAAVQSRPTLRGALQSGVSRAGPGSEAGSFRNRAR